MKLSHLIGGAVSALLVSQAAFAYKPDVTTPDLEVRLSGASATANAIAKLVAEQLCVQNANLDTFSGTNQKAVFCDMSAATAGVSGDLKVLVRKSAQGGSGTGVKPVCEAPTGGLVTFATFTTAGATPSCTESAPGSHVWNCAGFATTDLVPDAGTSDVKPQEVLSGASNGCGADVYPSYETVFGIVVSKQLRNALQEVQNLSVGTDDAANMPSLSTGLVSAIMAGRVKKWSDVQINGVALTTAVGAGTANGYGALSGADRVTICRRTDTSGTIASQSIRLLQRNCVAGALPVASSNVVGADINGPVIPAGQSGSDVLEQCLNSFSTTSAYAGRNGSKWAIGHDATDRTYIGAPTGQTEWRFVRLNGVLPTFENVANGSYKFSVSSTIQWNAAYLTNTDKLAIVTSLKDSAATPAALGAVRVAQDWGSGGVMALGDNGAVVAYDAAGKYDDSLPATTLTHNPSGTNFSNCIDPSLPSATKKVPLPTGN